MITAATNTQAPAASAGSLPTTGSSTTTSSNNPIDLSTNVFLQLLVAQLQNQDPTQPMDSATFVTQLAQFNSAEQLLALTNSVNTQVSAQQTSEAISLVGKTVGYAIPVVGSNTPMTGQDVVTGVSLQNGQVMLQVGAQSVPVVDVTTVS